MHIQVSDKSIKITLNLTTFGFQVLYAGKSTQAYDNSRNAIDDLINYNQDKIAKANENRQDDCKNLKDVLLIYVMVSLGVIILMTLYTCIILPGPITGLEEVSHAVADGDLTIRAEIESNDKLGQLAEAFNSMIKRLRILMLQLKLHTQTDAAKAFLLLPTRLKSCRNSAKYLQAK